jgi:hypothetical protein
MKSSRQISLLITLLLSCAPVLRAADDTMLTDVRSAGLADIHAPLASCYNPAAQSLMPVRALTFAYVNRYMTKELSTLTASYQQPVGWCDVSLLASHYGYEQYRRIYGGLAVGKLLKTGLSLGVRLFYQSVQYAANVRNSHVFSADVGLQYQPVDNLTVGMLLTSPYTVKSDAADAVDLPVGMELGVRYEVINTFFVCAELEKQTHLPLRAKCAVSYEAAPRFVLRLGLATAPLTPTAGVAVDFAPFCLDVAVRYHADLGPSPALAITYNF